MSNAALVLGTIIKLWSIWWPAPVLAAIIGALVSAAQKDKPRRCTAEASERRPL